MSDAAEKETLAGTHAPVRGSGGDIARGTVVGRYVVIARLGAGAMGVVYAAYDPELDRKVALKLVLHGAHGAEARRRIVREAQALAQLGHPNVVAVHDVGEHEGRVFIAMEFVQGGTLGAWCRAEPRRWQDVLDMLVAAGRGLAAAHERGLVHRDVKPDNIMVAPDGRVRVMDFGLARTEDEQSVPSDPGDDTLQPRERELGIELTRRGTILGTPAYMAPEQLRGELATAASDQFSWCVTFWEALYGERPFRGSALVELAANVLRGDVVEPRAGAKVPRWLRRVLERGLRPAPADRHASFGDLLRALERGVARTRRRWWTVAGAAVGVAIVGAWGMSRLDVARRRASCDSRASAIDEAWNPSAKARLHDVLVATGVSYAEGTFAHAIPHLDARTDTWRRDYAALCERTEVDGTRTEDLWAASRHCLEDRQAELASLVAVLSEADASVVQLTVNAAASLRDIEQCSDDVWLQRTRIPDMNDAEVRDLIELMWRAEALRRAGKYAPGIAIARRAIDDAARGGHDDLHRRALVIAGRLATQQGEHTDAARWLGEGFDLALAAGDEDVALGAATAIVYNTGVAAAKYDEGLVWGRIGRGLVAHLGIEDSLAASALDTNVATLYHANGGYEQAKTLDRRANATCERLLGAEHPTCVSGMINLAGTHYDEGDYDEAERLSERAVALTEAALGPEHPTFAVALTTRALVLEVRGRYEEAQAFYERSLAIAEQTLGPDHVEVASSLLYLAELENQRGTYAEAQAHYERALAIRERVLGPEHPEVARVLAGVATSRLGQGDLDGARRLGERALAIREAALGPDHVDVAASLANVAHLRFVQGEPGAARELFERALGIFERTLGADHPRVAGALDGIADARLAVGEHREAKPLFERALAIRVRTLGPDNVAVADSLRGLAEVALAQGDLATARHHAARAIVLYRGGARAENAAGAERVLAAVEAKGR